jgi:hypothetical protein
MDLSCGIGSMRKSRSGPTTKRTREKP